MKITFQFTRFPVGGIEIAMLLEYFSSLQTGYPIKVSYIGLLYTYPHSQ